MAQGVGPGVAEALGIGGRADAEGVEYQHDGTSHGASRRITS